MTEDCSRGCEECWAEASSMLYISEWQIHVAD